MLLQKFKIDLDKIKKRNDELMSTNWIDSLTKTQKKFLNWRKGPPKLINNDGLFGYTDLSDYLTNPEKFSEISISNLRDYIIIYGIRQKFDSIRLNDINQDLEKIIREIQKKRVESIQKYIAIEDSIFFNGINSRDIIYRMQSNPIKSNIIYNSTSWSLYPIDWFCETKECHLYVTKIPSNLKVIYLENKSKDKLLDVFNEFNFYEFEYLLPRNLEFIEVKKRKIKLPNKYFTDKNKDISEHNENIIIIHWIKIIKKVKDTEFPKISNVKLVSFYK
jgi:hypothetical protein